MFSVKIPTFTGGPRTTGIASILRPSTPAATPAVVAPPPEAYGPPAPANINVTAPPTVTTAPTTTSTPTAVDRIVLSPGTSGGTATTTTTTPTVKTTTTSTKPPTQSQVTAATNAAVVATTALNTAQAAYDRALASGSASKIKSAERTLEKAKTTYTTASTKATGLLEAFVSSNINKLSAVTETANTAVSTVDKGASKKTVSGASNANNSVNATVGNINKAVTALQTIITKNPSLAGSDIFEALSGATTTLTEETRGARNTFYKNAIDIAAITGNRNAANDLQVKYFTAVQNDVIADTTTAMQLQGKSGAEIQAAVKTIKTEVASNIKSFRTQLSEVNRIESTQLQNLAAAQKAELSLMTDAFKAQGVTGKALKTALAQEKTANAEEYKDAKLGFAAPNVQTMQGVAYDPNTGKITGNIRSAAATYADNEPIKTAVDTKLDAAFNIINTLNIPMSYKKGVDGGTVYTGLNVENVVNALSTRDPTTGAFSSSNIVTKVIEAGEKYIGKSMTADQLTKDKLKLTPTDDPNLFLGKSGQLNILFQKDADGNFKGVTTTRMKVEEDKGFLEGLVGSDLAKFIQVGTTIWNPLAGAALTAAEVGSKTGWDLGAMAKAGGTTYLSSQILPGVFKGITSGMTKAISDQLVSTLGETAANAAANGVVTGGTNALVGKLINPEADAAELFATGFAGGAISSSADILTYKLLGGGDTQAGMDMVNKIAQSTGLKTTQIIDTVGDSFITAANTAIRKNGNVLEEFTRTMGGSALGYKANNLVVDAFTKSAPNLQYEANVAGGMANIATQAMLKGIDVPTAVLLNAGNITKAAREAATPIIEAGDIENRQWRPISEVISGEDPIADILAGKDATATQVQNTASSAYVNSARNRAIADFKARGYDDETIQELIKTGTVDYRAQYYIQQDRNTVAQFENDAADYAKKYGIDSPEYKAAADKVLAAKANMGVYGVTKDSSGNYTYNYANGSKNIDTASGDLGGTKVDPTGTKAKYDIIPDSMLPADVRAKFAPVGNETTTDIVRTVDADGVVSYTRKFSGVQPDGNAYTYDVSYDPEDTKTPVRYTSASSTAPKPGQLAGVEVISSVTRPNFAAPPQTVPTEKGFFDKYGAILSIGTDPQDPLAKPSLFGTGNIGRVGDGFEILSWDNPQQKAETITQIELAQNKINADPTATEQDKKTINDLVTKAKDTPIISKDTVVQPEVTPTTPTTPSTPGATSSGVTPVDNITIGSTSGTTSSGGTTGGGTSSGGTSVNTGSVLFNPSTGTIQYGQSGGAGTTSGTSGTTGGTSGTSGTTGTTTGPGGTTTGPGGTTTGPGGTTTGPGGDTTGPGGPGGTTTGPGGTTGDTTGPGGDTTGTSGTGGTTTGGTTPPPGGTTPPPGGTTPPPGGGTTQQPVIPSFMLPGGGGQSVAVTPPELMKIGYFYDIGGENILPPTSAQLQPLDQEDEDKPKDLRLAETQIRDPFKYLFAEGGSVDDLLRILRG